MKDFVLKRLVNDDKDNIRKISIPLNLISEDFDTEGAERRMVIFLGANFRDLPRTDLQEAFRLTNQCLDYIRRECKGCDFYYKPHPAETDEANFLNLSGFKIEKKVIAELFYANNAKRIKCVFSVCSGGNKMAYAMGFNSYLFLNLFNGAIDPKAIQGYREVAFANLPEECFINDLSRPLRENKKRFVDNGIMEKHVRDLLSQKSGRVWLLIADPGNLANSIAIRMLIKKIDPGRIVNLIVSRHHRWGIVATDDFRIHFDNVFFFPRIFYSLSPIKILRAIKSALEIKRFPIQPEEIIMEGPGMDFFSNCFASYFKKSMRIFIMPKVAFSVACEDQKYSRSIFRTRLGAKFFNLILEPMLKIERTRFFEDRRRIHNVYRYLRPINDIFDYVWII